MDLNQCKEFFGKQYPTRKIEYTFDEKCHRVIAFILTDGLPNSSHQVECDKVKVAVEEMEPFYVPIAPHRMMCGFEFVRKVIAEKKDFYLHPQEKDILLKSKNENVEDYAVKLSQMSEAMGMPIELIAEKVN